MALAANALVSLGEAAQALGLSTPADTDAVVETLVNQASQLAETTYCMTALKQRTYTNLRVEGPHGQKLIAPLPTLPIDLAVTPTVSVDGVVQTVWNAEIDAAVDPSSFDVMAYADHFSRHRGWRSCGWWAENVVLTYKGGYATVPADLKEAVLELIQKLYGPMVQQRPDFASMAGPGGSLQTLDGQWSGAGSYGAWALSRRSKEVLDTYRRYRIG